MGMAEKRKTPFPAATENGVKNTPLEGAASNFHSKPYPQSGQPSEIQEWWKSMGCEVTLEGEKSDTSSLNGPIDAGDTLEVILPSYLLCLEIDVDFSSEETMWGKIPRVCEWVHHSGTYLEQTLRGSWRAFFFVTRQSTEIKMLGPGILLWGAGHRLRVAYLRSEVNDQSGTDEYFWLQGETILTIPSEVEKELVELGVLEKNNLPEMILFPEEIFSPGGNWTESVETAHSNLPSDNDRELKHAIIKVSTKRPVANITKEIVNKIPRLNNPPILFTKDRSVRVVERKEGVIRMDEVDANILTHHLNRWFRFIDSDSDRILKGPPLRIVQDLLTLPQLPFPELERITTSPYFDQTGTYRYLPGYQKGTLLLGLPLKIRKSWNHKDALDFLSKEFLGDFPFETPADLMMTLALGITILVRELIHGPTPLFSFEAPQAGMGKTLLARSILLSALGSPHSYSNLSADITSEDEWRKRIFSVLQLGLPAVVFDNLNIPLSSSSLSSILTSIRYSDRILGRSTMISLPIYNVWILTGNNPTFSSELARRVVTIRINAATDQPQHRSGFQHTDLPTWITAHQEDLMGTWASIVHHWKSKGQPAFSGRTLGSYELWSKIVGGILEACGIPGFLERQGHQALVRDLESEALQSFVQAWWEEYKDQSVENTKQLVPIAKSIDGWDLGKRDDQSLSIVLGKKLLSWKGRRFQTPEGLVQLILMTRFKGKSRYQLVLEC